MLFWIIVSVIILVIAFFVYREFREEKSYQKDRQTKYEDEQSDIPVRDETKTQRRREKIQSLPPEEVEVKPEERTYNLPKCQYPSFDYSRIMGLGLSEDDAIEFVKELIPQLKKQTPLIANAIKQEDFHAMEELTHSIKGSSTNIGTGGISDLLVEFNTYIKTGTDIPVLREYFKYLIHYTEELERKFS